MKEADRRLGAARLGPALVERPLAERATRLAAMARLLEQLHPDRPLTRGYAMVLGHDGKAVTTAALAAKEPMLGIKFADGIVQAAPGALKKPARVAAAKGETGQSELF